MILGRLYLENKEEYWNVVTHAVGFIAAAISTLILMGKCKVNTIAGGSVIFFGMSALLVYTTSVIFHLHWNKPSRKLYQTIDHISIFYLIAGTYTPFLLIALDSEVGMRLLIIVWSIALFGTLYKVFYTGRHENFSLILYVVMGWTCLLEYQAFVETLSYRTLFLLAAGGLLYLIGIIFFRKEQMRYNHSIWHVFVIMANLAHFAAVYTIL